MPNTKTKKFDWQIFLAVFCILLVICCATVCCVIGNTEKGVADAYTSEEIGITNTNLVVTDGFYLNNLNNVNSEELERLVNYYFYFIPDSDTSEDDFRYQYICGYITILYTEIDGIYRDSRRPFYLELSRSYEDSYLYVKSFLSEADDLYFFEFTYDFELNVIDEFLSQLYHTELTDYPYNYYVDLTSNPTIDGTFANQLVNAVFDSPELVVSIDGLIFDFYNTLNLGCIISYNQTFANPPVVMPEGVYDIELENYYQDGYQDAVSEYEPTIEDLQNQINQNNALIEDLREEIRYYESLDLNLSTIDVFNPSRMKSSTFVYDGVTYTSNSIVSTDDGWDVYSTTYNNQELPPNYGVGFSLFLPESITNTKFYVYGDITGLYNYTYCSEPDEQGNQQCYQVSDMIATISVGYRNQNGNIVKVGTFTSNLPGTGGVDFFIDTPTNEIVFFVENCNLMEVGRGVQVIYYQYDTQSIYDDGYESGKSQGIKIGREEGYYQGVADANDYSFFSLFTSVFDAPITAIVGKWGDSDGDGVYQREGGMLNFYIPGLDINFAPFLLSLFTIAIIILVIRFVMARKS